MTNYATFLLSTTPPLAQDSKATPWRRFVASALVVSFALGVIGAVAGAPLTPELAAEPLAQLVEARAAATRRKSSPAAALITRKRAEPSECADCPLLSSRF